MTEPVAMPTVTKEPNKKGDFLVDYEQKVFEDVKRAGSVCLNSLRAFVKWITASIMPPPELAATL